LVADDIKGNDHMFYAHLIDAKESKVKGRGSYICTGVGSSELSRVSLVLSRQLDGLGRVARKDVTPQQKWFEPEMVQIEGATSVTLGWRSTDGSSSDNNVRAAYTASVPSFKIGRYEVTQAQWNAVMAGTKFENYFRWGGKNGNPSGGIQNCGNVACDDQRPVEMVNWYLAVAFCNRLSDLSGKTPVYGGFTLADIADDGKCSVCDNVTMNTNADGYRLPTSDEWEYAARGCKAGNCESFKYSGSDDIGEVAWNGTNSNAAFANGTTHPVGQLKPNGLGIYDMSGNVWEWCWDFWGNVSKRELRGGSWSFDDGWSRIAARNAYSTGYCYNALGLRVVLP
jgi:formylglycine-generating enzyme required for sulfatase activity